MNGCYIGTFHPNGDAVRFFQGVDGWLSRVNTASEAHDSIVVVAEQNGRIQISRSKKTLCLADGLPPSTMKVSRAPRESYADAMMREWQKHGTSILRQEDVTSSLILCDAASAQLVLARAQHGVPPIFFAEKQDTLLWSDSITTLLQYGVETTLDRRALDAYFALGYVPSPWTFFKSVRKVPAGHFLDWNQGGWTFRQHREPVSQSRNVDDLDAGAAELKRRLCLSLDQIVEDHDRVGVLLSSGVDSSLLVGLLHCELGAQVEAFTFDYSDYNGKYNEYSQARRLTREYDIPHHKINYSGEWLKSNLPHAVRQYEEPFTYGHHTARLEPVKQKGISLLLSGVTGEMFISRTASYALKVNSPTLQHVAKIMNNAFRVWGTKTTSRLAHFANVSSSSPGKIFYEKASTNRVVSDKVRKLLYTNGSYYKYGKKSILSLFEKSLNGVGLNRKGDQLSHLKKTFIVPDHILFWNYRWSRAHRLTMRAPYFAPVVGPWMESLRQPLWPPYRESIRKILIRRAAATIMPEEIAFTRKIAQTAPFWKWFQGPLHPLLNEHLAPSRLREDRLFEAEFVQRELQKHIRGEGNQPYLVWSILCFMIWRDTFLESGDLP